VGWWSREWLPYAWALLLSSLATVLGLRLWHASLHAPFLYQGDALPTAAHFSTVLSQGWFEYEPRLGAPKGELYFDFPQADNLHLIVAKFIALFTDQWTVALNVYFLIGFPLAALAAVWFFRVVGVSKWLSVALAVAYAIAPYHFMRSEAHLYLGSYYPIPLALVLLVWVMRGEPLFTRRKTRNPILAVLTGRGAAVVLIGVILGTASQYYSVFFLILLFFAGIATLIRRRSWKRFWGAVVVGGVVAATLLVNVLPNAVYSALHGDAIGSLQRSAPEAEIYGFKLSQLLLPWSSSIIPVFRELRQYYDSNYPLVSEDPALGALAAAGLVAAFLVLGYVAIGWKRIAATGLGEQRWFQTVTELASLLFVAYLFGSIGGLSTLISFVTPAIRGWNRISIMMAAMALAVLGLLLDRFLGVLVRRARGPLGVLGRGAPAACAVLLVLIALVDQTPFDAANQLEANKGAYLADRGYFTKLEKRFPTNATMLQLPYIRFPEEQSANGVLASDELIPFLQTTGMKWTAGGIKGRPYADWPQLVEQYPADQLISLAAASGMNGILIDRNAYADHAEKLVAQLQSDLGQRPYSSPDGHWAAFDLASERSSLSTEFSTRQLKSVSGDITDPVMPYLAPDYSQVVTTAGTIGGTSGKPSPAFTLENPERKSVTGTLRLRVGNGAQTGAVTVTAPDGSRRSFPVTDGAAEVSMTMTVPAGESQVHVEADGVTSPVNIEVSHILFTESAVQKFIESADPQTSGTGTQ
jgi:phosphoglycerol transferase